MPYGTYIHNVGERVYCRVFGHFEKPFFLKLCRQVVALHVAKDQVCPCTYVFVYIDMQPCLLVVIYVPALVCLHMYAVSSSRMGGGGDVMYGNIDGL